MQPHFIFVVLCSGFSVICNTQMLGPKTHMTVPQLISSSGYPVEKHKVRTNDGYLLQMHRIPAGRRAAKGSTISKRKKAVLIVHGLGGCSSNFVLMGPERSLGYLLADAGYDVWLGNLRGNMYTTNETFNRSNPEFWAYSFEEHGKYDAPAMIDKIIDVTGLDKVLYIGHSMGTTTFFTMMSQRPEYNSKVVAFVALAPAVYLDNIRFLANFLLKTYDGPAIMRARGYIAAAVPREVLELFVSSFCNIKEPQADVCLKTIYILMGEDYEQNDRELMPVALATVQPAAWRQLEHYGKIAITGVFTKWENGVRGPVIPYDLSRVAVPVVILYGENDQLTEKSQIQRLAKQLNASGVLEAHQPACSWPKFNHLDFILAKDVGNLLNRPLVSYIDKLYNKYGSN